MIDYVPVVHRLPVVGSQVLWGVLGGRVSLPQLLLLGSLVYCGYMSTTKIERILRVMLDRDPLQTELTHMTQYHCKERDCFNGDKKNIYDK